MKNKIILLLISSALAGFSYAAIDGVMGPTSQGSVDLSITALAPVSAEIQITGLEDFAWGAMANGSDPAPITHNNICVYVSGGSQYQVQFESISATSQGFPSPVMYNSQWLQSIGYTIAFSDGFGNTGAGGTPLNASSSVDCQGSATDRASLTLDPGVLSAGVDGSGNFFDATFTDTLIITVSPW